jgi:hypothetical protein
MNKRLYELARNIFRQRGTEKDVTSWTVAYSVGFCNALEMVANRIRNTQHTVEATKEIDLLFSEYAPKRKPRTDA